VRRNGKKREEGGPRLSIIVPTLNEAAGIVASLQALVALRARAVEVIVADGGSKDGTTELCRPYCDRVVTCGRGRGRQMNAGAREARGEVLLFLHADVQLPPDADRLILRAVGAGSRVWGRFDVELSGAHRLFRLIAFMMNLRSRLTGVATGDQAMFVTRSAFESVGGFPEIALMEDVEMSVRLKRLSRPLRLSARVRVSSRRWERHGILRTTLLMWRLRLCHFFGADPDRLARLYSGGS
jgi:rSAM/selenodomain-associated transferase 2